MARGAVDLSRRGFLGGGFLRVLAGGGPEAPAAEPEYVARVLPTACIAFRGTLCVTCVERCPLPGAIALERGRPRVDASVCDGCGVCADVCPAPRTAIVRAPRSA